LVTVPIFSTVRIAISIASAVVAFSLYRFYRGGLLAKVWPVFMVAVLFQAVAGMGEMVDVLGNWSMGDNIERVSDIISVLAFLWFTLELRRVWVKMKP